MESFFRPLGERSMDEQQSNFNQPNLNQHSRAKKIEALIAHSVLEKTDLEGAQEQEQASTAISAEQKRLQGQAHYRLAKVYYDKADLKNAEEAFLQALELCEMPSDGLAMIKISGFLIRIYSEAMKKDEAQIYIDLSKMVLDYLFSNENDLCAEYFFYSGVIATYQGQFKEAKQQFSLAYKRSQQENEPDLVAKSLYSLAQNEFQEKNLDQALKVLGQLEQLLRILNKGYLKGSMNLLYAQIYSIQGKFDLAVEMYRKSLNELNHKMCWNLLGYTLLGLGACYKKMGEYKLSLTYFDLALSSTHSKTYRRLAERIQSEINEVYDSNVDFFIDKHKRLIHEKELGTIDFKHRFVLLEILFLLAKNPGQAFDKEQLSLLIWKEEYNPLIHDKLIYTSVSRLRKLIEPNGQKNKYIIRGKDGYTFNPHVNVRFHQGGERNLESIGNIEISSPI